MHSMHSALHNAQLCILQKRAGKNKGERESPEGARGEKGEELTGKRKRKEEEKPD